MKKWLCVLGIPVIVGCLTLLLAGGCAPKKRAAPVELPTTTVTPAPEVKEPVPPPEVIREATLEEREEQARQQGYLLPIYFDFDKYNIRPDAKPSLDKTAEWLSQNPTVTIRIEGNCDERGTSEYNLALGERRANSAMKYLVNMGISPDRISTLSYGEERPLDPGHNEAAWAKNRRDDFRIMGK